MKLYMVKASEHNIGDFQIGLVYAENGGDAIALIREEIEDEWPGQAAGIWDYINEHGTLTADEVPAYEP